jgi:hypothetical protein
VDAPVVPQEIDQAIEDSLRRLRVSMRGYAARVLSRASSYSELLVAERELLSNLQPFIKSIEDETSVMALAQVQELLAVEESGPVRDEEEEREGGETGNAREFSSEYIDADIGITLRQVSTERQALKILADRLAERAETLVVALDRELPGLEVAGWEITLD